MAITRETLGQLLKAIQRQPDGDDLREALRKTLGRPRLLLVLHADGWVEAYHEARTIDLRVVTRATVNRREAAHAADAYVEFEAGEKHAALYIPRKLRWHGRCHTRTPESLIERAWTRAVLKGFRE